MENENFFIFIKYPRIKSTRDTKKKEGCAHHLSMKRTIDDVSDTPVTEEYDFNRLPPELVRLLIGQVRPAIPGHSPPGLAVNHFKVHLNLSHTIITPEAVSISAAFESAA